jgi:hypothetical protein
MPLQVTEEEFRANMERDRAVRPSPEGGASASAEASADKSAAPSRSVPSPPQR